MDVVGPAEPAPFVTLTEEDVLRTYHFTVRRTTLRESAQTFVRDIEVHRGTVAVVAVTGDGRVALVRQYRIPLGVWTLEIPAGGVEDGEEPRETAARELAEETGLRPGRMRLLTRFANAPGHSTQWTTVFLATGCTAGAAAPAGPEEQSLSLVLVPLADVDALVEEGAVCDAKSVVGLIRALRELGRDEGTGHDDVG